MTSPPESRPSPATPPPEARRLTDKAWLIWLTTVDDDGQPQSSPVWFLYDGIEFLLYSRGDAPRNANIERRPQVAINLDDASTLVSVEGVARTADDPPSSANRDYLRKYRVAIMRMGYSPESFAAEYSVPIRVTPIRWRAESR